MALVSLNLLADYMARSRQKTPITGWVQTRAGSMRWYRRTAHKRERQAWRQYLLSPCNNDVYPHPRAFYNEWDSPRDGKQYLGSAEPTGLSTFLWHVMPSNQTWEEYVEEYRQDIERSMRK